MEVISARAAAYAYQHCFHGCCRRPGRRGQSEAREQTGIGRPTTRASEGCVNLRKLVRSTAPEALDLIANELRRAVAVGIASVPSTGMDSFAADLASALDALSYGADARLYLVLSPAAAKVVAFLTDSASTATGRLFPAMTVLGGNIAGIKVVVSDAATDAVLFDASQVCANSDTITIDASSQTSVQLSDAPTGGAANLVSLFQANMRAMRATRYFGAEVLRPEAVAVITGVTA
jgi:capsid protein